jgi:hypothetical protein
MAFSSEKIENTILQIFRKDPDEIKGWRILTLRNAVEGVLYGDRTTDINKNYELGETELEDFKEVFWGMFRKGIINLDIELRGNSEYAFSLSKKWIDTELCPAEYKEFDFFAPQLSSK